MIHWRSGALHEGGVRLDIGSPAFRYGAGFFETILWNGHGPSRLDAHLARLQASLDHFGLVAEPVDYPAVIAEVVRANGLAERLARVNIIVPLEDEDAAMAPLVTAAPYDPPAPDRTYSLRLAPPATLGSLSLHKSMNYMLCYLERRAARALGQDDAVLTQPGGIVTEATTAALLFGDGDCFCTPTGGCRLPSTTLAAVRELLPVRDCTVRAGELRAFRHAYMLNSLQGMRPVTVIGSHAFTPDFATCERCNPVLLGE